MTIRPYARVALIYLVLGVGYILFSDRLARSLIEDPDILTAVQSTKGMGFVLVSTLLIYFLSRRAFCCLERAEAHKRKELRQLLGKTFHIVLNYLNQMQTLRLEAEAAEAVSSRTLADCEKATDEAVAQLHALESELEKVSSGGESSKSPPTQPPPAN